MEEGADYIIGETFNDFGEGLLALQAIQKYGKGQYFENKLKILPKMNMTYLWLVELNVLSYSIGTS